MLFYKPPLSLSPTCKCHLLLWELFVCFFFFFFKRTSFACQKGGNIIPWNLPVYVKAVLGKIVLE